MSFSDVLKKGKPISGVHKDAKLAMVKELQKAMGDDMTDDVRGLKKVSVAAPDKESLAKGLDTAKELIGKPGEDNSSMGSEDGHGEMLGHSLENDDMGEEESPAHEASESADVEAQEHSEDGSGNAAHMSDMHSKMAELEKTIMDMKAELARRK